MDNLAIDQGGVEIRKEGVAQVDDVTNHVAHHLTMMRLGICHLGMIMLRVKPQGTKKAT